MSLPTPFDRLMQEAAKQATSDPQAAFARLDELLGKSMTAEDVLKLGAFAVHLGCAVLDRPADAEAFQRRLLQHPSAEGNDFSRRSVLRGLVVAMRLQGKGEEATSAMAQGVTTAAEKARLAVLTAQTFAARGRFGEATSFLAEAEPVLSGLEPSEDIVPQAAQISANLIRAAEGQLRQAGALIHAAARTLVATTAHQEWQLRHQALYHRGRAHLLTGEPSQTLGIVQELMTIEDANQAGPVERFFTASLACRAQVLRGMAKVAAAALEACRDYASRATEDNNVQGALADLEAFAHGRAG
jgi:hypothetical protein